MTAQPIQPSDQPRGASPPLTNPPLAVKGADGTPVESQALLQGQRAIAIRHNGEVYRLQATRLGKLILTK